MEPHDRARRDLHHQHEPGLPAVQRTEPSPLPLVALDLQWPLLLRLRLAGVSDAGIDRLIALRSTYAARHPALDGYEPDRRQEFVCWLVRQGRLRD